MVPGSATPVPVPGTWPGLVLVILVATLNLEQYRYIEHTGI